MHSLCIDGGSVAHASLHSKQDMSPCVDTVRRMSTTVVVLLAFYGIAALLEIAGIVLTVSTYIEFENGLGKVHQPETRWQAVRGPVLIGAGVLVGLGGNVASLFV